MSKKHHNNNPQKPVVKVNAAPVTPAKESVTAKEVDGSIEAVFASAVNAEEKPAAEAAEETVAEAPAEKPAEEQEPIVEGQKQPEAPAEAAPVKKFKVPKEKVVADDFYPTKISPAQRCIMPENKLHTPAGLKLIGLFEEYEKAMSVNTTDRNELARRARMLYGVVQAACPYKLTNASVGKDLVNIFFDKLREGWGTIYTDETVFRLDYTLPGGPVAIDKMNIFVQAMIQLVEAAIGDSDHIAFMNDRLAKIVDSSAIMTAVENLRAGIEKRIAQRTGKVG